jgi:plastocyanin
MAMMSRLALALIVPCAPAAYAAAIEAQVRDSAGRPLADAAVYAVSSAGGSEARGKAVAIEQIDREFVPYVSVVQAGTTASFPNRDPLMHHVYSFSPAKAFEIKLYSGTSPSEILFDKPGVVTLGCNIHDWMVGYVVVVPTSHFSRSDASGAVRLRDVPPGAYAVHAWHPQLRGAAPSQPIALDAGGASLAFTLDVAPRKAKYKPPLDRLNY